MGYKIEYQKEKPKKRNFILLQTLIASFLLLFSLIIRASWPEAVDKYNDLLVSDQLSRGAQALSAMVLELEQGADMTEAVEAFCVEIFGDQ